MDSLIQMVNTFLSGIPTLIVVVLLLILAFVVASVAKGIVIKALKRLKLEKLTNKLGLVDESTDSSLEFIGKLVYIIVFLLFMPGIFSRLGMQDASSPITNFISIFLNYVPNILAAIVILVIGFFIARIIRELVKPILKRLKVDTIQVKAGIEPSEESAISSVIAYIIYIFILIPVVIAALQVLNITAISNPAIEMLNRIFSFLPNIFVAIAIVVIGVFIANIVEKLLVNILMGVGLDTYAAKVMPAESGKMKDFSISKAIGAIVKYIIVILFIVEALSVIQLQVLVLVGEAIIAYLPLAISAVIIMGVAVVLSSWVENLILKKLNDAKVLAVTAKIVILIIAVLMTLSQLNIATSIVNAAFIILLSAFAVAFAIAFGIGGRDFAAMTMKRLEKTKKDE